MEQEKARIKKFEISGKSLRIWPVTGSQIDISDKLRSFLAKAIEINRSDVDCLGIQYVERVRNPPKSKIVDEVRVIFTNEVMRDELANKGKCLAKYHKDGKPTAGFRPDIPDYLGVDNKALVDYSWRLKKAHGRATRSYIKYDDVSYGLYMELSIPGSDGYLKITPNLARQLSAEGERDEIHRLHDALTARPKQPSSNDQSTNFVPIGPSRPSVGTSSSATINDGLRRLAYNSTAAETSNHNEWRPLPPSQ